MRRFSDSSLNPTPTSVPKNGSNSAERCSQQVTLQPPSVITPMKNQAIYCSKNVEPYDGMEMLPLLMEPFLNPLPETCTTSNTVKSLMRLVWCSTPCTNGSEDLPTESRNLDD